MNFSDVEYLLGKRVRVARRELKDSLVERFKNPIVHKEIHGDKVYIPLDLNRIWDKTY